jgi:hypothetical protein
VPHGSRIYNQDVLLRTILLEDATVNEVETLPAPILPVPPPLGKWEQEYRAFLRLLPQLLQTHRGQFVAIHEGRVVDSDSDEMALARRAIATIGPIPIHIDRVAEQPPPVERITHRAEIVS